MAKHRVNKLPSGALAPGDTYVVKVSDRPRGIKIYIVGSDGIPYESEGLSLAQETKLTNIQEGAQRNPNLKTLNGQTLVGTTDITILPTGVIAAVEPDFNFATASDGDYRPQTVPGTYGNAAVGGPITVDGTEQGSVSIVKANGVITKVVSPITGYAATVNNENLFDKDGPVVDYVAGMTYNQVGRIRGAYMNPSGVLTASDDYDVTDFIVLPQLNVQYTASSLGQFATNIRFRTVFNASNVPQVGSGSSEFHNSFTTGFPKVRLSIRKSTEDVFMLVQGTTEPTEFIPSGKTVTGELKLKREQISPVGDLRYYLRDVDKFTPEELAFAEKSINLIDLSDPDVLIPTEDNPLGWFISSSTGLPTIPTGTNPAPYASTGFVDVQGLASITVSVGHLYSFYNAAKTRISGGTALGQIPATITVPANAVYFRQGFTYNENWPTAMIVSGSVLPTNYVPGGYILKGVSLDTASEQKSDEILLRDIPSTIYGVVGQTIELYHNSLTWTGNHDNFHYYWSGVGRGFGRKWSMQCTSANIGSHSVTLRVYNNNMGSVLTKTITIVVIPNNLPATVNTVIVGDSWVNNKAWETELMALSSNRIKLIGTRWGTGTSGQGWRHEGRSGWTTAQYNAEFTYTFDSGGITGNDGKAQSRNPFYNPTAGAIDFNYYVSNYNLATPDAILLHGGLNGLTLNPDSNVQAWLTFINAIKATGGTNVKFFVCQIPLKGNQDGLGKQTSSDGFSSNPRWQLEEDRKIYNFNNKIFEVFNGVANVYIVPADVHFDREYNYGWVNVPVNPRSTITRPEPTEAVHATNYAQLADAYFSVMCGALNQ